jgi:hypothetical protein
MDFSKVLISGAGFLADAYDLFVINVAVDIMDKCNYSQSLTNDTKSTIKTMALVGAVVGQLGIIHSLIFFAAYYLTILLFFHRVWSNC